MKSQSWYCHCYVLTLDPKCAKLENGLQIFPRYKASNLQALFHHREIVDLKSLSLDAVAYVAFFLKSNHLALIQYMEKQLN